MQIQHTMNTDTLMDLRQYVKANNQSIKSSVGPIENDAYVSHISTSAKVMGRLDEFLNMGQGTDLSLDDMSEDEQQTFLSMLSALMKKGVVGYEMLEIEEGQPEKYFIVNQIGSEETYGKPLALPDDAN